MMKLILILCLMCSFFLAKSQDPNFYIFLCFRQSNMEGQGAIESIDSATDSRFQVLQAVDCPDQDREKSQWYTATPPLTRCGTGLSPVDYFGRTLIEKLPAEVKVGVITVAVGGCKIELFDKDIYQDYTNTFEEDWFQNIINTYGGNPYEYLVGLAKEAQQDGVIKGILLHQGESNNGDNEWPSKVKKIYGDLINDLELDAEQTPLLAGEMVNADQGGALAGMNAIIAKLPETLLNAHVISSKGCEAKSDKVHFNAEGYRELGSRYGLKMLQLLGYEEEKEVVLSTAAKQQKGYFLSQNYPNPAGGATSIMFRLPVESAVSLKLYDEAGRAVAILIDKIVPAGEHIVNYELKNQANGIYYYTLKANTYEATRKILVE